MGLKKVEQDDIWVQYSVVSTRKREDPKTGEKQVDAQERIADALEDIVEKGADIFGKKRKR